MKVILVLQPLVVGCFVGVSSLFFPVHINAIACPEKLGGGGGGAQCNFPTRDHQNIFNLILN